MNGSRFIWTSCGQSAALGAIICLMCCAQGCGDRDRAPVYPVAGRLFIDGRPAAQAMVAFHPLGSECDTPLPRPVGVTDSDGNFFVTTYSAGDGAPVGDYAVTVVWPDNSVPFDECGDVLLHDRLRGKYAEPRTSRWRTRIVEGPNQVSLSD